MLQNFPEQSRMYSFEAAFVENLLVGMSFNAKCGLNLAVFDCLASTLSVSLPGRSLG